MAREFYVIQKISDQKKEEIKPKIEEKGRFLPKDEFLVNQEKVNLLIKKINVICARIKELNPKKISPHWLFSNCRGEYDFIKNNFRALSGEVNWQLFFDFLPDEQKGLWGRKIFRSWNFEKAKDRIVSLLKAENPKTFNPNWIRENDLGLYKYLKNKYKNGEAGKIEWEQFIVNLLEEWQGRWIRGASEEALKKGSEKRMKLTFGESAKRLNDMLIRYDPPSFNSKFVENLDPQLHSYFKRYILKENGGIDWAKILDGVDDKFRKRFIYPKKFDEAYPSERYWNEEEVENYLGSNKEKLLTFFGVRSAEDIRKRNDLCLALIKMAKAGNSAAEEKLINYLEILAQDWIEKDKLFDVYKINNTDLFERMKRCIYLFQENGSAGFVGYLYINLREQAKGLRYKKIELDAPAFKDNKKRSRHETFDLVDNSYLTE